MKVTNKQYLFLLLIPFIAAIIAGMIFTPWQTNALEKIGIEETFDSSSIMGWMTFNDVAKATKIPLVELYRLSNTSFEVDPNTPFKEIKNIGGFEEFETANVRIAVDNYQLLEVQGYKCPYGIEHDPAPGLCGLYTDEDGDGSCDYELG
jgi:hypothetical protein